MKRTPIAVCLTDTHLNENNLEINKKIYRQATDIAKSMGFNTIHHLADIFDSRKAQTQKVLSEGFFDILNELTEQEMRLVTFAGNHDKTSYASHRSFLDPYTHHPAFWFTQIGALATSTLEHNIFVLPYYSDEEYIIELDKLKKQIDKKKKNILFTHIGVNGAVMNNGTVVASSVTPASFKGFDAVYIGHYHDAQSITTKIHYIGASIQHNFGEQVDKGLTVIYDDLSWETIPLDFPRYIKKEIDVTKLDLKEVAKLKEEHKDDQVRIVLTGKKEDLSSFNTQQLTDLGVRFAKKQDVIDEEELTSRVEPFNSASLTDAFKNFCKEKKLAHKDGLKYFNQIKFKSHV